MQSNIPVSLDWNGLTSDLKNLFKVAKDFMEAYSNMMKSGPHYDVKKVMTMLHEEINKLYGGNLQAAM